MEPLSAQELNRALLARRLLLERSPITAAEAIGRLVAIQPRCVAAHGLKFRNRMLGPSLARRSERFGAALEPGVVGRHGRAGTDPMSMLLETVPLILLFEASLLLARLVGTPGQADRQTELAITEASRAIEM
jgi:hypothetical protein